MSVGAAEEMETPPPSKKFSHRTDELAFTHRPYHLNMTRVYLTRPPKSLSSSERHWIVTCETTRKSRRFTYFYRHPLTSKPYSINLPPKFHISQLNPLTLSVDYAVREPYSVDKLLLFHPSEYSYLSVNRCTLFALYGGGQLQGCPRYSRVVKENCISPWVKLTQLGSVKFDDIIDFEDKTYAIDRQGITKLINHYKTVTTISIGKTLIFEPLTPGSGLFGWRKRFVVDEGTLYLVVRKEEKLFHVFRLNTAGGNLHLKKKWQGVSRFYWDRVWEFGGNKVLFMARDHYFFLRASRKFPGREYMNCIVFSEAAFPQYGNDGWEFTESDNVRRCEDDIAVFCLDNERFVREGEEEGENSGFPKIDWSPPDWILNVSSFPAAEFMEHPESESFSQSERAPHEDEGLDPDSGEKNDGEVQSGLKDSKTKDEEQEVMEYDFGSQDQDQGGVESDSDSQDQEDEEMQCDSNSQEKDDEEMHSKEANIEGDATLQKDPVTPSRSAVEEEVTGTLLRMNSGKDAMEEETLGKNITQEIPKASISSRTENHESDTLTTTTKFEGLDIRSDLVPTLQKIWLKHGNIIKDSIVRSGDIVARALESLAIMVRILEDNPAQSLSDSQADYLTSTLSDLRNICFKVYWLVSFVEKALKVHRSKPLVESLNNLSQLSSQVKERRAILLSELANLNEEENKLKEEMAKVSKRIPFSGQVKFDEPIGAGLTE